MNISVEYVSNDIASSLLFANLVDKKKDCHLKYTTYDLAKVIPVGLNNEDFRIRGGVLDVDNQYVVESAFHECEIVSRIVYPCLDINNDYSNINAIYIGQQYACWGHAITDNLAKIWFLFTEEGKRLLSLGYKVVFTTIFNVDLPEYIKEIFDLLEIEYLHIRHTSSFKKILIPQSSLLFDGNYRYFTEEFKNTINILKGKCNKNCNVALEDKIYFSRSQWKSWVEMGENDVESLFVRKGYKVIYPENHTVLEQINMVSHANSFAATEGSIAHISMFASSSTKIQILMKANYVNSYQCCINQMADLDVEYINVNNSTKSHPTHPWWGPFYLFRTKELIQWSMLDIVYIPYYLKIGYYKYILNDLYEIIRRACKKIISNKI